MSASHPSLSDRDIASIAARITRPVVLVGLMGVGKSTVGRKLAAMFERTSRRANRPLLKQGNPREILNRLARERAPFYAEAPIRVVSETGPHADTARAIIKAIDEWL